MCPQGLLRLSCPQAHTEELWLRSPARCRWGRGLPEPPSSWCPGQVCASPNPAPSDPSHPHRTTGQAGLQAIGSSGGRGSDPRAPDPDLHPGLLVPWHHPAFHRSPAPGPTLVLPLRKPMEGHPQKRDLPPTASARWAELCAHPAPLRAKSLGEQHVDCDRCGWTWHGPPGSHVGCSRETEWAWAKRFPPHLPIP